jgi:hypothetical protein
MENCNLIEDLKDCVDDILGIRDQIGAVLDPVYLVTRTWIGARPGDGSFIDSEVQVLPSPYIVDLSHNLNIKESGSIKQGDILLKNVSKNSYQTEGILDGSSDAKNIEKLYRIGEYLYQVIKIKNNYVTWDIQVRRLSDQRR